MHVAFCHILFGFIAFPILSRGNLFIVKKNSGWQLHIFVCSLPHCCFLLTNAPCQVLFNSRPEGKISKQSFKGFLKIYIQAKTHIYSARILFTCATAYSVCWTHLWYIVGCLLSSQKLVYGFQSVNRLSFHCLFFYVGCFIPACFTERTVTWLKMDSRCTFSFYVLAQWCASNISAGHDEGSMPNHK